MSLEEAAAALDRLLAGHTQEIQTSRPSPRNLSTPLACWGIIAAPTCTPSPLARSSIASLKDRQPSEGVFSQNTLVITHGTPKDDTSRHIPPLLPRIDETLRAQPSHSPPPPQTPDLANHFLHASDSIHDPALHSFRTSTPITASSSAPASSILTISAPFQRSLQEESLVEAGAAGHVSGLWSVGVRGGRRGGRVLASLLSRPDPNKFKTELCRSYHVHGFCRYGPRCNYAHGLHQLRGAAHHGKYKTRNCKSYHEMGCCRYGARCSFIHDPVEGVLKCSIANKEVLEALHYCPASEESYRTAKITWRLVDSSSTPPSELHFITSNTQPAHLDAALLSSGTDEEYDPRKPYDEQDFVSVSLPVVSSASLGVAQQREDICPSHTLPISASWLRSGKGNSTWSARPNRSCSENERHHSECCQQTPALAHHVSAPHHSSGCSVVAAQCGTGRWYDPDELLSLEVVQQILQDESYSIPWSTVADLDTDAASGRQNLPDGDDALGSSCSEITNMESEPNYMNHKGSFLGREDLSGSDKDDVWGDECEAGLVGRPVLSSTLRSDSDSEEANKWVNEEWLSLGGTHATQDLTGIVQAHPCLAWGCRGRSGEAFPEVPPRRCCYDLTKYKTEMCRSFQFNSQCGYGDACLYAHGTLDLRSCPRHPMYRTKHCFTFHHKGYCLYGTRCHFMHDLS